MSDVSIDRILNFPFVFFLRSFFSSLFFLHRSIVLSGACRRWTSGKRLKKMPAVAPVEMWSVEELYLTFNVNQYVWAANGY